VRALYRYFPTEWMTGQRNVEALARAIEAGALRTLTGFAHIFTQSKFAFARAWDRVARGQLPPEDCEIVRLHTPETWDLLDVDRAAVCASRADWVVKRAMGRVGDEVFVGELTEAEDWARLVAEATSRAVQGERWIVQRYVRQSYVPTPWGDRLVTLGAYVADGRFAGYFARITARSHVSHDALCVPVFVLLG
jgi:hypothetical protein